MSGIASSPPPTAESLRLGLACGGNTKPKRRVLFWTLPHPPPPPPPPSVQIELTPAQLRRRSGGHGHGAVDSGAADGRQSRARRCRDGLAGGGRRRCDCRQRCVAVLRHGRHAQRKRLARLCQLQTCGEVVGDDGPNTRTQAGGAEVRVLGNAGCPFLSHSHPTRRKGDSRASGASAASSAPSGSFPLHQARGWGPMGAAERPTFASSQGA